MKTPHIKQIILIATALLGNVYLGYTLFSSDFNGVPDYSFENNSVGQLLVVGGAMLLAYHILKIMQREKWFLIFNGSVFAAVLVYYFAEGTFLWPSFAALVLSVIIFLLRKLLQWPNRALYTS